MYNKLQKAFLLMDFLSGNTFVQLGKGADVSLVQKTLETAEIRSMCTRTPKEWQRVSGY